LLKNLNDIDIKDAILGDNIDNYIIQWETHDKKWAEWIYPFFMKNIVKYFEFKELGVHNKYLDDKFKSHGLFDE
jgi:hypothetical protein